MLAGKTPATLPKQPASRSTSCGSLAGAQPEASIRSGHGGRDGVAELQHDTLRVGAHITAVALKQFEL
jgi:hypothetical protein